MPLWDWVTNMFSAKEAREEYQKFLTKDRSAFLDANKEKISERIKQDCKSKSCSDIFFNHDIAPHNRVAASEWLEEFGYEVLWSSYDEYMDTHWKLTVSW